MNDLRWILLGIGALFLGGLAIWELRRPRHAAKQDLAGEAAESAAWREQSSIRAGDDSDIEIPEMRATDTHRDPPLIMLDEMHASDADIGVNVAMEVAVDRPGSGAEIPDTAHWSTESAAPLELPRSVPIVWPPLRQERIIWLRVVPAGAVRFSGRALRHALTSCGLVHGPQDIFHWADDKGNVVASAANLVRPGSFDLGSMDAQHYQGIHLFAVLPGPLPAGQAFDELLALGRDIASRLSGVVQDERGQPVDAARVADIRASLQPSATVAEDDEDGA
jgi:cell division protein ZipA